MTTKIIHNIETNEIIEVPLTAEDLSQIAKSDELQIENQQKAIAAAEARAQLLEKLGITEEEAKLLLG